MDKVDRNIFCLIGDGESREGQIWEAMDFVADHSLTNVIPIFNCNELAQSDYVSPQQSAETLAKKAEAYGFIARIIDGHDPEQISKALNELHVVHNGHRPLAIVARTVKGWGSPAEQGMGKHGTPVKKDKLKSIFAELDQTAKDRGVADYKLDGELKVIGSKDPAGFELCGATQESCRFARSELRSVTKVGEVLLADAAAASATRVRFCWADSPLCNLFDTTGLPVGPFELPIN
jgi:hypothetical protein